jgi:CheY-like chemotaxis protein
LYPAAQVIANCPDVFHSQAELRASDQSTGYLTSRTEQFLVEGYFTRICGEMGQQNQSVRGVQTNADQIELGNQTSGYKLETFRIVQRLTVKGFDAETGVKSAHIRAMPGEAIHILLVEDNPHDVRLFNEVVAGSAVISVATNGAEALDRVFRRGKFQAEPVPDLVVLDLNTPLLNGHEVLNALKANSQTRRLPVIVWTGSDNPQDIRRAFDLGCAAYMLKTIDLTAAEARLDAFSAFWLRNACYPALEQNASPTAALRPC